MPRKKLPKLNRWSERELDEFKMYIIENSDILRAHFLINTVAGYMRFRKPKCYFIGMGTRIGRSSKLCKSKFQKLEHKIYVEFLKFPVAHFELFCYLRTQKANAVDYDFIRKGISRDSNQLNTLNQSGSTKSALDSGSIGRLRFIPG